MWTYKQSRHVFSNEFLKTDLVPFNAEQPLQCTELQEKEEEE